MFFDSHTHSHFAAFSEDYKEVITRALSAGVGLVNVGTQRDTSKRAIEVAHEFEREPVYATVGLHPIHTEQSFHDIKELGLPKEFTPLETPAQAGAVSNGNLSLTGFTSRGEEFDKSYYTELARDAKVVAIGECGLDYYRLSEETKKKQAEVFIGQIEVAHAVNKPLMIHCRNAFPDLIALLTAQSSQLKAIPGIIHFFTGTPDDARALLELGFSFTFGGVVTFTRDYDEAIKIIPKDRILSETDAPYVAPVPFRGKRNEPAYVIHTVKKLAELKGVSADEMQTQIWENAKRIWGI
jgi:TatD DNase family protein